MTRYQCMGAVNDYGELEDLTFETSRKPYIPFKIYQDGSDCEMFLNSTVIQQLIIDLTAILPELQRHEMEYLLTKGESSD